MDGYFRVMSLAFVRSILYVICDSCVKIMCLS